MSLVSGNTTEILIAGSPGFGHIEPSVRLACYFTTEKNVHVTLIIPAAINADIPSLPPCPEQLRVIRLDLPAEYTAPMAGASFLIARKEQVVSDLLSQNGLAERPIAAVIYDMLSTQWCSMLADTLGLPQYVFIPGHLTLTYLSYRMPEYFKRKDALRVPNAKFEEVMSHVPAELRFPPPMVGDINIDVPGVMEPITGSDLFELPPAIWHVLVDSYEVFYRANGAIVQDIPDFYSDSKKLITAIEKDQRARAAEKGVNHSSTFKVYTTGPLSLFDRRPLSSTKTPEIEWLDRQQPGSVLFVASGSWCQFSIADTIELARGIQMSDLPFLWAYRAREGNISFSNERELSEAADETGLPASFREDTKNTGMVVSWVDQAAVLKHPALSCFITHCGWNSTMEALSWAGVPLVLLPLGADQGINANLLENEWRCGQRVWDVSSHRQLERSAVSKVIKGCATNEEMRKTTQRLKSVLKEAAAPGGHVARERARFLACLDGNE